MPARRAHEMPIFKMFHAWIEIDPSLRATNGARDVASERWIDRHPIEPQSPALFVSLCLPVRSLSASRKGSQEVAKTRRSWG